MKGIAPVFDGYFADPFAWQHEGEFFAVGTGQSEACGQPSERVFPLLHSKDFAQWKPSGAALIRPDRLGDTFWAPEVAYEKGVFYLYYSVGWSDKSHQLRVATSETALGPYRDSGTALTNLKECPFAIDPHPFCDDDGQWYLFYARDFLERDAEVRAGTALVMARLETMTRLSREERVVQRARYNWQRFMKDRPMYGGMYDWHTLEGPCVRKHAGRYYCFYSGGRWENDTYGVDYGLADDVLGPYSGAGGSRGPRVLRTIPGVLHGPGHNSIVAGPDSQDYIVFHAWDSAMTARRMFVRRLVWTAEGPTMG